MPPLREIREDIPLLANHFLAKYKHTESDAAAEVSPEAMAKMMAYHWPGNVRQLENVIQRALALGGNETIQITDLPNEIAQQTSHVAAANADLNLKALEKNAICRALENTNGNKVEAAKLLGVNPTTVYRKMAKYNINA
jgi:DNA-binding NtrC family response regulator